VPLRSLVTNPFPTPSELATRYRNSSPFACAQLTREGSHAARKPYLTSFPSRPSLSKHRYHPKRPTQHVQVEGDRVRKRHATLEAWTSSPKNDDSALPAGLKPLLHNIPNSTIPDWRLHTAAESGDFGSTRVCPPRSQRFALSIYGASVSISQMLAHVQRTMRSSPRGRGACGAKLLPAS
jgi:hypothetical protein